MRWSIAPMSKSSLLENPVGDVCSLGMAAIRNSTISRGLNRRLIAGAGLELCVSQIARDRRRLCARPGIASHDRGPPTRSPTSHVIKSPRPTSSISPFSPSFHIPPPPPLPIFTRLQLLSPTPPRELPSLHRLPSPTPPLPPSPPFPSLSLSPPLPSLSPFLTSHPPTPISIFLPHTTLPSPSLPLPSLFASLPFSSLPLPSHPPCSEQIPNLA